MNQACGLPMSELRDYSSSSSLHSPRHERGHFHPVRLHEAPEPFPHHPAERQRDDYAQSALPSEPIENTQLGSGYGLNVLMALNPRTPKQRPEKPFLLMNVTRPKNSTK
jgi:hypothetical protein